MDFVSNMVGANTGTIELRATFPNSDQRLVPGQNVNVGVTVGQIAGATVVPRDAVNAGPGFQLRLCRGQGQVVASKTVKVLDDDGTVDAIQGDVKPGDQVVVEGQLRIMPGQPRWRSATMGRPTPPSRRPTCRHEHLENLHRKAGPHHAADGGAGDLRPVRLFELAGQRIAGGGFSHHRVSASLPGADPQTMARRWRRRWKTSSPPFPASAP